MPKPSKMEVVATDDDDSSSSDSDVNINDLAANSDTESDEEETEVLCSGTVLNYSNELDEEMPQAVQEPFSFSSPSESSSSSSLSVQQLSSSNLQSIPNAPGCYHNDKRLGLTIGGNIRIDGQAYIVAIKGLIPELNDISSVNSSSSSSSTNEATLRRKRRPSINSAHENSSSSSSSSSAPPSSSSSTSQAAKRQRTTQASASSSSATHNLIIESFIKKVNNLPSILIEYYSNYPQDIDIFVEQICSQGLNIKEISPSLWNSANQLVKSILLSRINPSASSHPPVPSARQQMPINPDTSSSSSSRSSSVQARSPNIPSYDPKSVVPEQILGDIKNGVTKKNENKVTIKSGDTIRIIFKDNDGNYSDNKYRVEINGTSISLINLGNPLQTSKVKMSYCLYCDFSTMHHSNLTTSHKNTHSHREKAGLPPLPENKGHKCTSCNTYKAVTSSNLSRHQERCQSKKNSIIQSITEAVDDLSATEIEEYLNTPGYIDILVEKIRRKSRLDIQRAPDSLWDFAKQKVKALLLSRINPSASSHPPVPSARQQMPISHDTSSSSSSSSAPPSSSSSTGPATKRQRATQVSTNSRPVMQPQHGNIPSSDSKSEIPPKILELIKQGVTMRDGNKVTIESGDVIQIIFENNDGKYIVNKYKVEKNESSISLISLENFLRTAMVKISHCLYCDYSTTRPTNLITRHARSDKHRENAGLPPLSEDKVYKCTSCNTYTAVTSSNLSRHQKECQRKYATVIKSITAAVNGLPPAEIEKCSNNPQHIDTLVKKIVRESLKSLKRVPDSLLDFAEQAVKNHLLSRINPGASSHPPVSSARQQHVPQDEMPTSHNTSSSSSSTSIKQEPTIKEEGNRSEDDMSDEDNGYSFFSNQSTPQPQSAGSPWVPFAEQRQVTNVDFPQEIINIPSYLFDEGQVVIGRTVIHDGQEYIILSFSSMQRKRS